MKRFLGSWIVCLVSLAGCDWSSAPQQQPMAWAPAQNLEKVGLQEYWVMSAKDLDLDSGEGLRWIRHLQEHVYCLTNTNRLIALDAKTGLFRWSVQVAPEGQRVYDPLHASAVGLTEKLPSPGEIAEGKIINPPMIDAVIINSSNQVMVIDRKNGRVARRIDLEHSASTRGATDGVMFYVGTAKGWYYGVSLQMGVKTWTLFAGDAILSPLECATAMVYVAAVDGSIHVAKAGQASSQLYVKAVGGRVTAPMHVDSRGCFIPCEDNFLYTFNSDLSQRLWSHPFACKGPLRRAAQIGERTVFQRADGDRLYAINLADGEERWNLPQGMDVLGVLPAAGAESSVYVRDAANRLLVVDEILGTVKATASLGAYDLFVESATEPMIYAAWHQGRVACLRPLSAGRITSEMLQKSHK